MNIELQREFIPEDLRKEDCAICRVPFDTTSVVARVVPD